MDMGSVSKRYAKALYKFAVVNAEDAIVYRELQNIIQVYLAYKKFQEIIINPLVKVEVKKQLIFTALGDNHKVSKSLTRFVEFIIQQKRCDKLIYMAYSYVSIYQKEHNVIQSNFIVPVAVDASVIEQMKSLVQRYLDGHVDFNVKIEPSIIGGFILEFDSYRLDASVKSQLQRLKQGL
ncbi:MAG: F0F1 ATP synthase subunit delta [Bacteroidaceae bacterium]|nr:F0F1 ATP synthase subunit delta [Bacteroidaceae bacterium]